MNRNNIIKYIKDYYNVEPESPWDKYPQHIVFRHPHNRKWFAIIMNVEENKIGLPGLKLMDVIDLKCDKMMVGSLLMADDIYPGYHMNKQNWITLILNEKTDREKILSLLDISFELTK